MYSVPKHSRFVDLLPVWTLPHHHHLIHQVLVVRTLCQGAESQGDCEDQGAL